jgi:hypothetical protein
MSSGRITSLSSESHYFVLSMEYHADKKEQDAGKLEMLGAI